MQSISESEISNARGMPRKKTRSDIEFQRALISASTCRVARTYSVGRQTLLLAHFAKFPSSCMKIDERKMSPKRATLIIIHCTSHWQCRHSHVNLGREYFQTRKSWGQSRIMLSPKWNSRVCEKAINLIAPDASRWLCWLESCTFYSLVILDNISRRVGKNVYSHSLALRGVPRALLLLPEPHPAPPPSCKLRDYFISRLTVNFLGRKLTRARFQLIFFASPELAGK